LRRKTNEQFQYEVHDLVGDEYTFLDTYVNNKTKLRVKHNKCGNVYKVTPHEFFRGSRCPFCNGGIKKTDLQFKKEIHDLVGDEYTFLDPYINSSTKLRVKHNRCGQVYKVKPNSFLRGSRCPFCNGGIKKTDTEFKHEVYDLVGDEYTFLDAYVNSSTKLRVKHNECGHIYKITPNSFLMGTRCAYCSGKVKRTDDQFKQQVYALVGDEYSVLSEYQSVNTRIKMRHNICGNVFSPIPKHFLRGSRCPYCAGNIKKTNNQFVNYLKKSVGSEYVLLSNYVNSKTKVLLKHNKCGNVYEVTPNNFMTGYRCPFCNSPKGEVAINKILKSLGIKYEYQKTFDDLRDVQPLSYDFYIPDQSILIEYQGLQHYEPVDHFGGESQFKLQRKHDKLKSEYAKDHGYNLIAIPYTYDTFSKIKKYLIKHGLKK
jgi:uncharacterized protein with PIN domain